MAYATETRTSGATLGQRLSTLRTAIADRWAARRTYRTTCAELDALTDRELTDLGISRAAIPQIAQFAAYGDR